MMWLMKMKIKTTLELSTVCVTIFLLLEVFLTRSLPVLLKNYMLDLNT